MWLSGILINNWHEYWLYNTGINYVCITILNGCSKTVHNKSDSFENPFTKQCIWNTICDSLYNYNENRLKFKLFNSLFIKSSKNI